MNERDKPIHGLEFFKSYNERVNAPKPQEPRYETHRQYPFTREPIKDMVENLEIQDNAFMVQAIVDALCASTNPTILDQLKRLYMLSKLSLDADDPIVDTARQQVRVIDDNNAIIDRNNKEKESEYKGKLHHRETGIRYAGANARDWWDDSFIPFMNARWTGDLKDPWIEIFIKVLKENQTSYGLNYPVGWKTKKAKNFDWLLAVNWQDEVVQMAFAYNVVEEVHRAHIAYVDKLVHAIYVKRLESYSNRLFEKQIQDEIYERHNWGSYNNHYYDDYKRWKYRTTTGNYRPYDDAYDPYDSQSRNDFHSYDSKVREQVNDYIDLHRKKLYWEARADITKRHKKGEPGLEIIYWEENEPKPMTIPKSTKTRWASSSNQSEHDTWEMDVNGIRAVKKDKWPF